MELKVHLTENGKVKNISVLGGIETKNDVDNLLKELDDISQVSRYSITFMEASILCAQIVERLSSILKMTGCKVYVFKRYLYLYLRYLGIKCEYVLQKSLCCREVLQENNLIADTKPDNQRITRFLEKIHLKYGYDYTGYQEGSIKRRIKIAMLRENTRSFEQFEQNILEDPEEFEQLFLDFSINTTEFFRDPEIFLIMRNRILPYLSSHSHIKIWCAGCSNGKEPYSLAILLDELGLLDKTYIYATDINPYIIEEAKNGLFSTEEIDKDIIYYKKADGKRNFVDYFELKDSYMKVRDYLQKNILFFQHSIIEEGIINEFQLILCRNVFIYLKPHIQNKVLSTFSKSLDLTGFLILGKSEGMLLNGGYSFFADYLGREKIYRPRQQLNG